MKTIEKRFMRNDDPNLQRYLRDASEVTLLTMQEEIGLANAVRSGDAAARERMIRANLLLAVKIALEYEHCGLPLLDLISEGNIGLMKATDRFDPTRGAKFSTYAAWWIRQGIKRALSDKARMIRLPTHMVQQGGLIRREETKFFNKHERKPNDEELAAQMDIDTNSIKSCRAAHQIRVSSLDAPLTTDSGPERKLEDVTPDDNAVMPWSNLDKEIDSNFLKKIFRVLNKREYKIITARFGLDGKEPRTLEDIAQDFSLTRERIRQLQEMALRKLRRLFQKRDTLSK